MSVRVHLRLYEFRRRRAHLLQEAEIVAAAPVLDQTAVLQTDDVDFRLADALAGRRQAQKEAVVGAMVPLPDRFAIAGGEDILALQLATALRKPVSRVEPAVDSLSGAVASPSVALE